MDTEFGGTMFGGPLFLLPLAPPTPPAPPPPYVDSASYFRTDFTPENFKRKFSSYPVRIG